MSEWDIGQTGGAAGNSRRGLTDALMLRFGGEGGGMREPVGKTFVPQERKGAAFSDVLAERSSSVRTNPPSHGTENRVLEPKRQDDGTSAGLHKMNDRPARTLSRAADPATGQEPGRTAEVKHAQQPVSAQTEKPLDVELPEDVLLTEETEFTDEPAPEVYAGILVELMSALKVEIAGVQPPETEGRDIVPPEETGAPLQQTEIIPDASMEDHLHGLIERLSLEAAAPAAASIVNAPEAFLQKLHDLLETVGVAPQDLLTASKMENTDVEASLHAKLFALAEGVRVLIAQTAAGVDTMPTQGPETDAADMLIPVNPTASGTGDMDQSSTDGEEKNERHIPTAFAAAGLAPEGGREVAATAQGMGVHLAAMEGGRTFGQQVSHIAQSKAESLPQMPMAPETSREVASQVMTRLQTMSGDEKHEMELQLKPESLGKIQLRIVEERGQVLAKFTAESEKVRAILESNMQLLKDALEKNGLTVQELSVSVGHRQQERQTPGGPEDGAHGNGRLNPGMRGVGNLSTESSDMAGLHIRMSARAREYLYGPDSTLSLKA